MNNLAVVLETRVLDDSLPSFLIPELISFENEYPSHLGTDTGAKALHTYGFLIGDHFSS